MLGGGDTVRFVRNLAKSKNGHGQNRQNGQNGQNGHGQNGHGQNGKNGQNRQNGHGQSRQSGQVDLKNFPMHPMPTYFGLKIVRFITCLLLFYISSV